MSTPEPPAKPRTAPDAKSSGKRAVQGLATLALLKVNFDRGRDHLDMFMPFLLDTINSLPDDTFSIREVKDGVSVRHHLTLPVAMLGTLMTRASRRGYVQRKLGRYTRDNNRLSEADLSRTRELIEQEHASVALAFREFASTQGVQLEGDDEALGLILGFFEHYHVAMLIDDDPTTLFGAHAALPRRESTIVAKFLQNTFRHDRARTAYVQRMLEGFVLQNALLLKDIATAGRRFSDLEVFFDTGFVLRLLGFAGETYGAPARETAELIRSAGARIAVFEKTIAEVERILKVYERHLGSASGIALLRPTDVTQHLVTLGYTPSDIRQAIALLPANLKQLGVRIRGFPKREARFTCDEPDLSKRLMRDDETELSPRVAHDVDCVAGIVTFRQGHHADSLDHARAIFATTSSSVVTTVRAWYAETGERGIPPVVHAWALSNVAWLKKPIAAGGMKLSELVALCSAALRPGARVWQSFLRHLKRLEADGQITSEEKVAVVVAELTETHLAEIDDDVEVDSPTVLEIVERVRAHHVEESVRKSTAELEAAKAETANAERQLADARSQRDAHSQQASGEAEKRRQIRIRVYDLADSVASVVAWLPCLLLAGVVAFALVVAIPITLPKRFDPLKWPAGAVAAVVFFVSLWRGTTFETMRSSIRRRVAKRLAVRWLGPFHED